MKKVFILRGLPGSGKSTFAKTLSANIIISADDFFVGEDGVYRHDPRKQGEAHNDCFRRFVAAQMLGDETIVVDNTNISASEIAPYALAGVAAGYNVEIVTVWCDVSVAFKRNIHGVPPYVVLSMFRRMLTEDLPPYWQQNVIFP